jgi:hypothetical protein
MFFIRVKNKYVGWLAAIGFQALANTTYLGTRQFHDVLAQFTVHDVVALNKYFIADSIFLFR